jgi:hypothetical protein
MTFLTGDPAEVILGDGADRMSVQQIDEFRTKMGFDRPWYVQYADFVVKALQGDFGESFIRHKPAYEVIAERLPATIQLAAFAFVLSLVVSIPLEFCPPQGRRRRLIISSRCCTRWAVDSKLLARHSADPVFRRIPQMASDFGQRHVATSHHAWNRSRRLSNCAQYAPDALVNAGLDAA